VVLSVVLTSCSKNEPLQVNKSTTKHEIFKKPTIPRLKSLNQLYKRLKQNPTNARISDEEIE
jgi:hypothetical protein